MYRYRKTDSGFELVDGDTVLLHSDKISICFDKRDGTLHKHGDPQTVMKYFNDSTREMCDNGLDDMAIDYVVITSSEWDTDVLNKCLDTTGWVVRMVRMFGIKLIGPVGDIVDGLTDESIARHGGEPRKPIVPDPAKFPPFNVEIAQFMVD